MANPSNVPETSVWHGTSSQLTNVGTFLWCFLLAAVIAATPGVLVWLNWVTLPPLFFLLLLVPVAVAFKAWLDVQCRRYELTTQRLRISQGILSRRVDDLELYRVKDLTLEKPLALRLLGLGNVVLMTSDHTTPTLTVPAIRRPEQVRDLIRQHVESQRDRKRVQEVDFT